MQICGLIVKKHPAGFHYVPIEKLPDGSQHPHKGAYLQHLVDTGHQIEIMPEGHIKLVSGPHAA